MWLIFVGNLYISYDIVVVVFFNLCLVVYICLLYL